MSRTRIVKGTYTKITKGNYNMYAGGNTNITALGKNNFKGDNNTIYGNNPQKPPVFTTEKTRVKTIVCLDDLDEGAANDGEKGTVQKGIIHGKSYKFEVSEFTDGEPLNEKSIKWKVSCINSDTGDTYSNVLKDEFYKGKNISINFNVSNYCGYKIIVKAYIENSETEGQFNTLIHYRFRWFDREILKKEIKARTDDGLPWKIDQNGTSLCGMASIFYLFAKEQPEEYKKFALELHRTGECQYNDYKVTPDENLYKRRPYTEDETVNNDYVFIPIVNKQGKEVDREYMPLVDYITLGSVRNTGNGMYKGGNEQVAAINWPWFMVDLCKKFLGYSEVDSKGIYNPIKPLVSTSFGFEEKRQEMNQLLADGYRLILMIDSDLIDDRWDFSSVDLHWVVLETPIEKIKGKTEYLYRFKVFSWGCKDYPVVDMTWSHFINNFNGYIKVK